MSNRIYWGGLAILIAGGFTLTAGGNLFEVGGAGLAIGLILCLYGVAVDPKS